TESFKNAEEDKDLRNLLEAKVEVERELMALEQAIIQDQDLLTQEECDSLHVSIALLKDALNTDQLANIQACTHQLKVHSDAFAALRMNRSVSKALKGTSLTDWR
ncbi:MAG TPA: Fe-S protein assembly chaperone HscA, partial [Aquirhabdus sp.]